MFHLIILLGMIPVTVSTVTVSVWQTGVYLVVPYLLTCVLSIVAGRRVSTKETGYCCMGSAVLVSGLNVVGKVFFPMFYEQECFGGWLLFCGLLICIGLKEMHQMVYGKEEICL